MGEMKRETDRKVLGVFRTLLGLPEPWKMLAVEIKEEEKLVEIEVEWPEAVRVACPECQRACGIYDHQGMRWWRHLDTMGHTTRLCCRVPHSECPEHKVKTVTVPWARFENSSTRPTGQGGAHYETNPVPSAKNLVAVRICCLCGDRAQINTVQVSAEETENADRPTQSRTHNRSPMGVPSLHALAKTRHYGNRNLIQAKECRGIHK